METFLSSSAISGLPQGLPYEALEKEALVDLLRERDTALHELRQELRALSDKVQQQEIQYTALIEKQATQIERLKGELKAARDHLFGVKSEKGARLRKREQASEAEVAPEDRLFDEAAPEDLPSKESEEKTPGEKKASGGRRPLPTSLPQDQVTYDITETEKVCSCGSSLSRLGSKTFQTLDYVPAQLKVITHHRLQYVCKFCEETFHTAPLPPRSLPKTIASPSLLAHILVSKFDDHLPLYRQAEMWNRQGIEMSRATLSRWVIQCGGLLEPLVTQMHQEMCERSFLQGDETRVQVMGEENRANTSKSYMWCFKTQGNENFDVIYHYSPSRSAQVAKDFLQGFKGVLTQKPYII